MSASELKRKFPDLLKRLAKFMETHRKELIKRFVIMGPKSNKKPDYIYYGDETQGLWARAEPVLRILSNGKSRSVIPVGKLTFQAWNRAINGNKSEKKRGEIQLKWPSIIKDLNEGYKK